MGRLVDGAIWASPGGRGRVDRSVSKYRARVPMFHRKRTSDQMRLERDRSVREAVSLPKYIQIGWPGREQGPTLASVRRRNSRPPGATWAAQHNIGGTV